MANYDKPSANALYGGSLWHAFDAFTTSNSTQYLENKKKIHKLFDVENNRKTTKLSAISWFPINKTIKL